MRLGERRVGGVDRCEGRAALLAACPEPDILVNRLGTPEEFGAACAFLCSAHAGYASGQNLQLDGGSYPGLIRARA